MSKKTNGADMAQAKALLRDIRTWAERYYVSREPNPESDMCPFTKEDIVESITEILDADDADQWAGGIASYADVRMFHIEHGRTKCDRAGDLAFYRLYCAADLLARKWGGMATMDDDGFGDEALAAAHAAEPAK